MFNAQFATALGITDVADGGIEARCEGVTGHTLIGHCHEVILEVGGNRFANVGIAFTEYMPDNATRIIGQDGFLDLFPIKLTYRKREIELLSRERTVRRRRQSRSS